EVEPQVTTVAGGLVEENIHAAHLSGIHRLLVPRAIAIEGSVARVYRPFECGDGFGDVIDVEVFRPEDLLEALDVSRYALEALHDSRMGRISRLFGGHLDRV